MTEEKNLRGFEIRMSEAAKALVIAKAKENNFASATAYIRSLIAAQIPELKPEFDELAQWGGNRKKG